MNVGDTNMYVCKIFGYGYENECVKALSSMRIKHIVT